MITSSEIELPQNLGSSQVAAKVSSTVSTPGQNLSKQEEEYAQVANTNIDIPEIRSLRDAGLTPERLEIIASIDFKPINLNVTGAKNKVNILDNRFLSNQVEITKLINDMAMLKSDFPDEYAEAENQYQNVIAASESDINIFKLLLLMKEYGVRAPRFLEFMEQFSYSKTGIGYLGNRGNLSNVATLLGIQASDFEFDDPYATNVFVHTYAMLNFAVNFGDVTCSIRNFVPTEPNEIVKTAEATVQSGGLVVTSKDVALMTKISRNLSFSNECVKIRDDKNGNERLKDIIERIYSPAFLTSKTNKTFNLQNISGIATFAEPARDVTDSPFKPVDPRRDNNLYSLQQILRDKSEPIIASIQARKKPSGFNGTILLPEGLKSVYNGQSYSTTDSIIDDAFSVSTDGIDLKEYTEVTQTLVSSVRDATDFNAISFKSNNYAIPDGRTSTVLGSSVPSLTPGDVSTTLLEVFNRRFASVVNERLSTPFRDFGTEEHVSYTKLFSYVLLRENPSLCKEIFSAFIDDYNSGFLTAREIPEEGYPVVNILPGTDRITDLTGRRTHLSQKLSKLIEYYRTGINFYTGGPGLAIV